MHTSNTLKTVVLLSGLAGFMVLIGALLGGTTGLVIGLLFGLGIVGASYWSSDKLAVKAARATEVVPGQLDWLRDDLAAIARRADMPTPRLFISPDLQPNAFATGRNEKTAVVCVTAGLLQVLDRQEVRGVVAHEVAHIRNKDILIGSIAAAVATAISAIANLALFAGMFGGNSNDDEGPNPAGRDVAGDPRSDGRRSDADGAVAFLASSKPTASAPSCSAIRARWRAHSRSSIAPRSRSRWMSTRHTPPPTSSTHSPDASRRASPSSS